MTTAHPDSFKAKSNLDVHGTSYEIFRIDALRGVADVDSLPYSIRVLLEMMLRYEGEHTTREQIEAVARYEAKDVGHTEIGFTPARVLLQDFTGVPCVVDLASMRESFAAMGGDPTRVNPLQPVDLVIDHSVQVDAFGSTHAFEDNIQREFERNAERYRFLKWGQNAFHGLRVVPPDTGIVHQVNIEYLAQVVFSKDLGGGKRQAYPDTLVGTDSHTTMANGLGIVGWGVGGIEAEAAMLGQPSAMLIPAVVGFELKGKLRAGVTATDLVLTVTEMLRKKGVVGKFVEFHGEGLDHLPVADRATLGNMAPEYGATIGYFPIDEETLKYLRLTGRTDEQIALVETYAKAQGLFRVKGAKTPRFTDTLSLDLADVGPSLAGPKRPQDRIALGDMRTAWEKVMVPTLPEGTREKRHPVSLTREGKKLDFTLGHGDVVIAAITSCTNTSNPSVMLAAGLLAKRAVERGLTAKPWVKTSLAPGSQVVTSYLERSGLLPYLEQLGFFVVGYGCTTCIGNSGPLEDEVSKAISANKISAAAVLSGNRNFEGRISPDVRANYLASPPLVVAFALAGNVEVDLEKEPIGKDKDGKDVFLRDLWPTPEEVASAVSGNVSREQFLERYADVFHGRDQWREMEAPKGDLYAWDPKSTYIAKAPFFDGLTKETPKAHEDIRAARALALLGDSITTDHISPAGNIKADSPAGRYLQAHGIAPRDFNSYGSRRGHHDVMVRGTFANIRIKNKLADGAEGGVSRHFDASGKPGPVESIYDVAERYIAEKTPLVVIAGKEYGTGSSRDWAAKGTYLQGVDAVIAESFERIHRSNLVGMGVLPLQFMPGESATSLGLEGTETFDILGIGGGITPGKTLQVVAHGEGGEKRFDVRCRIDSSIEVEYHRHGGILQYVLRQMAKG